MVKSLKLLNYKSHKETKVKFGPGINGIIGQPSSGKTNIIRALRLVTFNRPGGIKFVRNRAKHRSARIEVELEPYDLTIIMEKGEKSFYQIGDEVFEKFGKDVPDKIQEVLNLSSINFHNQLDEPFLITSKPSAISQSINQMTGMDQFDIWIDKTNEKIRSLKTAKIEAEIEFEKNKIEFQKLHGLDEIEPLIARFKRVRKRNSLLTTRYERAAEIIAIIKDLESKVKKESQIFKLSPYLKKIDELEEKILNLFKKKDLITELKDWLKYLKDAKRNYNKLVEEYVETIKEAGVCPTCLSKVGPEMIKKILNGMKEKEEFQ
jgi:DNA repair exonuclease SbcCD ATPase subunit